MQLMRQAVIAVADNPFVTRFFTGSSLARGLVDRFVAGETLDEAIVACHDIVAQGMTVTLDQLGENVHTQAEVDAATATYVDMLRRMRQEGLAPNVSVKLTMLGLI